MGTKYKARAIRHLNLEQLQDFIEKLNRRRAKSYLRKKSFHWYAKRNIFRTIRNYLVYTVGVKTENKEMPQGAPDCFGREFFFPLICKQAPVCEFSHECNETYIKTIKELLDPMVDPLMLELKAMSHRLGGLTKFTLDRTFGSVMAKMFVQGMCARPIEKAMLPDFCYYKLLRRGGIKILWHSSLYFTASGDNTYSSNLWAREEFVSCFELSGIPFIRDGKHLIGKLLVWDKDWRNKIRIFSQEARKILRTRDYIGIPVNDVREPDLIRALQIVFADKLHLFI